MSSYHENVPRRGLPPAHVTHPQNALVDEDAYWVQILGFPPESWGAIRNVIEMQGGHLVSEVRHPGCNWAFVRFQRESDRDACLELDQTEWLPRIWIHASKAEAEIVRRSVLLHNRPLMVAPENASHSPFRRSIQREGLEPGNDSPPRRLSLERPQKRALSWSQVSVPSLSLNDCLGRIYILPIIQQW